MTTFEIIITVFLAGFALMTCGIFAFKILKTKCGFKRDIVKGHRELWTFYIEHCDKLKDLFDRKTTKKELTEEQFMFITMLFNHMELCYKLKKCDMLSRTFSLKEDWLDIMSYPLIKVYWQNTYQFREKDVAKYINKLIDNK